MKRSVLAIALLLSVLRVSLTPAYAYETQDPSPQAPSAPADTPAVLVSEPFDEYALHEGVLYWDVYCYIIPLGGGATADVDAIKRKPVGGGVATTIVSSTGCNVYEKLAVDDSGLYYHDTVLQKIRRIPANVQDASPVDVAPLGNILVQLKLDGEYVYYRTHASNTIWRVPKTGGTPAAFINPNAYPSDFVFDANSIYWFDAGGLWWANKNCAALPCVKQLLASGATGSNMRMGQMGGSATVPGSILYVQTVFSGSNATRSIRELNCSQGPGLCTTTTHYIASLNATIGEIGLAYLPRATLPILDPTLFWTETSGIVGRLLRRVVGNTASPAEIYTGAGNLLPRIYTEGAGAMAGLYFAQSPSILFLPYAASATVRDLEAVNMEVTQAIQNRANDIQLITGKKTYVRATGRQNSGPQTGGVEARLVGLRGSVPLPGSPLAPVNGTLEMAVGKTYSRENLWESWLFELPSSWYGTSGNITLRLEVDPRGAYADSTPANNSLTRISGFASETDICMFFSPVRTANPIPKVGDPNFWQTINRFMTLWPGKQAEVYFMPEPIEELQACSWHGVPYPCFGPYEMDQPSDFPSNFPSDSDRVIGKLILRQIEARALALDPISNYCSLNSPVHSVGLVHPSADTTDDSGRTTNGYANLFFNASWYKMEAFDSLPSYPRWYWPRAASVLAQEVTHNYWRGHVNCGNPENPDTDWPYADPCKLNDGGQNNYYGFDTTTRSVIPPEVASDFMSYNPASGQNPLWLGKWVSDYTYRAIADHVLAQNAATPTSISHVFSPDEMMVSVTGAVDVTHLRGSFDHAYQQLVANMNANAAQVWGELYAPPFAPQSPNEQYHLRLKDAAGNVIDDRIVTLLYPDPHEEDAAHSFILTFPAPAGTVARMELLANEAVLASRDIGPAAPAINLIAPGAGYAMTDQLTIQWSASDADAQDILHFHVDYSPDNGENWIPLATDQPYIPTQAIQSYTLKNPMGLPGSAGATARVRVRASDGYNTSIATSPAFSVAQRAPVANIIAPVAGQSFEAGADVPLNGNGFDAESGLLGDDALAWQVDGISVGGGLQASARGLAPGTHTLALTASDPTARTGMTQTAFRVNPLSVPAVASPVLDGVCDDNAYSAAQRVQLAPYADDNSQASAALVRTDSAVWVCLSGLARGSAAQVGRAGLQVDVNNSRDANAQSGDYFFLVGEDGALSSGAGNGSGGFTTPAAVGFDARTSASANVWQAELHIPLAALGGANHSLGLMFTHSNIVSATDRVSWPFAGQSAKPNTWAQATLGNAPDLTVISPTSTTVGSAGFTLVLTGSNFTTGTVALWNGAALATSVVSSTRLTASVTAAQLTTAAQVNVQVRNAALSDAPSAPLVFAVNNPTPVITTLSPNVGQVGGGAFTLVVSGGGFAPGAIVLWDGAALETTFINTQEVRASADATRLDMNRAVDVTVQNPAPGGGSSNPVVFVVNSGFRVLLPVLMR